jgi:nitrite reductase (NADH) large subunit
MTKPRVVVIGNGMVGSASSRSWHAAGRASTSPRSARSRGPAYDRVQLTSFFSGKTASDLNVVPEKFFQQNAVTLRLNDSVLALDLARKVVRSTRYKEVPFDKLVLATGSYPFVPPLSGSDRRDCFVYRTIEDLEVIAGRRSALEGGRGDRRGIARPGGRESTQGPGLADAYRRVRLAPDGGAAR